MAKIAICGSGYVGLTAAACLADLGNLVYALDNDPKRIRALRAGRMPIFEPGLQEAVARNAAAGRLLFTTSYRVALAGADFAFIAVGTPSRPGGEADVTHVRDAATAIAADLDGPLIVVNKSTVPIGTADLVAKVIASKNGRYPVVVLSNPEFMREGQALHDFMHPDRIIIGSSDRASAERFANLYEPLGAPVLITDIYTAEMIKYSANALLATKISFINEMARIAELFGADIKVIAEGMGLDKRIGPQFLDAGLGFGGSCLPKDIRALTSIARRHGHHPELLAAVIAINDDQRSVVLNKLRECLGSLRGKTIGLWGLSFKPNTDDLRDAPSLEIARQLRRAGARVRAYDPAARTQAKRLLRGVDVRRDPYAVARGADAIVLVTEWNEFRQLDLERVQKSMRSAILIDGRNVYEPREMRRLGFTYRGIGRN